MTRKLLATLALSLLVFIPIFPMPSDHCTHGLPGASQTISR